jgi:hypothetical protein
MSFIKTIPFNVVVYGLLLRTAIFSSFYYNLQDIKVLPDEDMDTINNKIKLKQIGSYKWVQRAKVRFSWGMLVMRYDEHSEKSPLLGEDLTSLNA